MNRWSFLSVEKIRLHNDSRAREVYSKAVDVFKNIRLMLCSRWCSNLSLSREIGTELRLSLFDYIPPSLAQVLEVQSFPVIKCHSLFEFDSNSFFSELARSEPLGR